MLAALLLSTSAATAQTVTVLFDEDDATGATYRDASHGSTEGTDLLTLTGPDGNKMPIVTEAAYRGSTSGLLEYRHSQGGIWTLDIATNGFGAIDISEADSLVFYLSGPFPTPGPDLPRFRLVDAAGHTTAALAVDTGRLIGFNAFRSGFEAGSTTDAIFQVEYLDVLPPDQVRPGYPEDLLITFSDAALDTSRAVIGVPGRAAKFKVETAFTNLQLDFSFRDLDNDSTLSRPDEFIDIYTPEAEGAMRLRPAWRLAVGNTPAEPPGEGDVYRLAVNNGGLDGDPTTWQRIGVSLADFGPPGDFDLRQVQAIRFLNGTTPTTLRTLWVDYVAGVDRGEPAAGPEPPAFTVLPGDSSFVLRWELVAGATGTYVYRQATPSTPFENLTVRPVRESHFADLNVQNGESYTYILRSLGPGNVPGPDSEPVTAAPQAGLPDIYLDLVAETAFAYFWNEANPANGLIKDRSTPSSASSIAAVGFGLSALTVGIDRGWITRAEGTERVLNTLEFFWNCPQGPGTSGVCGYRGFFYHFLNMQTGLRSGTTELSTIDTALLLGGVLDVGVYFNGSTDEEEHIRELAASIYERVEWDWAQVRPPAISHGWRPESGFIGNDWIGYNEAMILYILALGSPTHPVGPNAWTAWTSGYDWETHYGYSFVRFPPLFGHQYSHVWIDFRGIQDGYMREKGIDYFENSRRATLAQRAYHIANPQGHPNYGPNEWGLTASDIPNGYRARGAPPAQNDEGTLAPTAPGGSIAFTPAESAAALRTFYRRYRADLWGSYGLRDAYNIRENWFASAYLGIDQGPILLMIENYRTEAIWDRFMTIEAIRRGLERAGFDIPTRIDAPGEVPTAATLAAAYPNPFVTQTHIRYTLHETGPVTVIVYDPLGRKVATLVDTVQPAGTHETVFEAGTLPSGLYFYTLHAGNVHTTRSLIRLRP